MRLRPDVARMVDDPHMLRALALAARGRGRTSPNPCVGAVVVRNGEVVGEGFHPAAGQPHAEVFALAQAGERARGATLYVTLEPCRHHGKTPPCTDAIVAAGIAEVVIGMPDPTADAGRGAERLAEQGVGTSFWPDARPFERLLEGWLTRVRTGLPFVRAKAGLSLDGHGAFEQGLRADITGAAGREVTSAMRDAADAVVVSAATVSADDPALTVRDAHGTLAEHQPLRVVLIRESVPPVTSALLTDCAAPTLVLASDTASQAEIDALPNDVLVERYAADGGLRAAFGVLGARGLNDVLVEPGPRLLTSLLAEDLIGELVTVVAGGMAGASAPPLYLGKPDREDESLSHRFAPRIACAHDDVAITVWGRIQEPVA